MRKLILAYAKRVAHKLFVKELMKLMLGVSSPNAWIHSIAAIQ